MNEIASSKLIQTSLNKLNTQAQELIDKKSNNLLNLYKRMKYDYEEGRFYFPIQVEDSNHLEVQVSFYTCPGFIVRRVIMCVYDADCDLYFGELEVEQEKSIGIILDEAPKFSNLFLESIVSSDNWGMEGREIPPLIKAMKCIAEITQ